MVFGDIVVLGGAVVVADGASLFQHPLPEPFHGFWTVCNQHLVPDRLDQDDSDGAVDRFHLLAPVRGIVTNAVLVV